MQFTILKGQHMGLWYFVITRRAAEQTIELSSVTSYMRTDMHILWVYLLSIHVWTLLYARNKNKTIQNTAQQQQQ